MQNSKNKNHTKSMDLEIKEYNNNQYRLIDLLEDINKIDGIERIRLRIIGTNFNYGRICG